MASFQIEYVVTVQDISHSDADTAGGLRLLPFSFPFCISGLEVPAGLIVGGGGGLCFTILCKSFGKQKVSGPILLIRSDYRSKLICSFRKLATEKQCVSVIKMHHPI